MIQVTTARGHQSREQFVCQRSGREWNMKSPSGLDDDVEVLVMKSASKTRLEITLDYTWPAYIHDPSLRVSPT